MNDLIRENIRDKHIRRKILLVIEQYSLAAPMAQVSGRTIRSGLDSILPAEMSVENDDHLARLVRELMGLGFVQEIHTGAQVRGAAVSLDRLAYRLTASGMLLLSAMATRASEPGVCPLIEDDRL